jgi:biotin synthase-related radical SAM superfamily protein
LIEKIRVAFGTGAVLGLWHGRLDFAPTTAHFLTYQENRCRANCKFCPQASGSTTDLKMLSRVFWPSFDLKKVMKALGEKSNEFSRVCIQAVNYLGVVNDLCGIVARVKEVCELPVSVSCQPLAPEDIRKLADSGVNRLSVALDAATRDLFTLVKGEIYSWNGHLGALEDAKRVFGGEVSTHLIVGLGESEEEMVRTIQLLHDKGITVALFAFTPIPGTPLSNHPRPDISSYRRVQVARFLIVKDVTRAERMVFEGGRILNFGVEGDVLNRTIESGEPFITSGCPGCNRPFYNESPRGPLYNYPRRPKRREMEMIKSELNLSSVFGTESGRR